MDGHRINDAVYAGSYFGTDSPVDVDDIERVEIIRGPGSSLYGSNALFAVVNVITRRGREVQGAEVSAEVGTLHTYKGRASVGQRFQTGLEVFLSGSYYRSAGQRRLYYSEYDEPGISDGVATNRDGDATYKLLGSAAYRDFTLQGLYAWRKKSIPTGSFGTIFNDPHAATVDEWYYADLKFERSIGHDWHVLARVFYDAYHYRGSYPYAGAEDELVLYDDEAWASRVGSQAHVTTRIVPRNRITLGVDSRFNLRQEQKNYDKAPYTLYLDDRRDSFEWGVYLQDEVTILANLILNAGVRYDHSQSFGGTTNPRLAVIYTPVPATTIKALFGTAFRAPNAYELYYSGGGSKANPDLDPETITTGELTLEQYIGRAVRGTVTGFYYVVDDLINATVDPDDDLFVFRNTQRASSKGVEIELEGKWANGWLGRVSYTYQHAEDTRTRRRLSDSPLHLAKLNVIAPIVPEHLFAGLELLYGSARRTVRGNEVDGSLVTNLTLFATKLPLKGLEVSGSVYNLFDTHERAPVHDGHRQEAIRQDGRVFRLKLTYAF